MVFLIQKFLKATTRGGGYTKVNKVLEGWMKDGVGHAGMLSGDGWTYGANFLNCWSWKWDKKSAILLSEPVITILIWWYAAQKYNMHTNNMVSVLCVEPFRQMSTTEELLQWNKIFYFLQNCPHVCTAQTMAKILLCCGVHLACSQHPFQKAPYPFEPEALVDRWISGLGVQFVWRMKEVLDQKVLQPCKIAFRF